LKKLVWQLYRGKLKGLVSTANDQYQMIDCPPTYGKAAYYFQFEKGGRKYAFKDFGGSKGGKSQQLRASEEAKH
jgi:hypothetical protein